MIEEVSTRQSVMAVVKAAAVVLFLVVGGVGSCAYGIFFLYDAGRIAKRAAAAVKPGQTLQELLSNRSEFMQAVQASDLLSLDFGIPSRTMSGGNQNCGSLSLYRTGKVLFEKFGEKEPIETLSQVNGHDWGPEFVEKYKAELKKCNILSTNLMKGIPRHCPIFVEYDQELKVVRAGTRPCWD